MGATRSVHLDDNDAPYTIVHNVLALFNTRLERWLDILVPLPLAYLGWKYFSTSTPTVIHGFQLIHRDPEAAKVWTLTEGHRQAPATQRGDLSLVFWQQSLRFEAAINAHNMQTALQRARNTAQHRARRRSSPRPPNSDQRTQR